MSGIPVDMLVDIDDSYGRYSRTSYLQRYDLTSQQDDDPFELSSMQSKYPAKDLGLELGLALEKSIKLRSQFQQQDSPTAGTPLTPHQTDLGILVNIDESPDKKALTAGQSSKTCEHVKDSVFTHAPSNPFDLAWDVIEHESLKLAEHIEHDKEKSISPRKMVDLALKLSPDSLLLSPRNDARDEELLIHSSPELDMKKTPKVTKAPPPKGRVSIGSSPAVAKSYATPLRSRQSLINPSPMRKNVKTPLPSPAKPLPSRSSFKPPLLRSSSATTPLNHVPPSKPLVTKAGPMKAIHQQPLPSVSKVPLKTTVDTPVRRSLAPSTVTSAPPPILSYQSKLRAPLSRAESDSQHQASSKMSEFQRQNSIRVGLKRVSISHPPSVSTSSTHANRVSAVPRAKAKGRENIEP